MNLRGNSRLRVLLMGAVAAGVFGPQTIQAGPFSVWKKPSGAAAKQPAPTVPPELLSAPPSDVVVIQPVVQTVTPAAATTGNKSEVMRQLELLYEKDGREMPELNTDIRPVPTNPTGTAPNGAAATSGAPAAPALRTQQPAAQYQQPQQQYQPAPAQQQYQPAQARQSGQQYLPAQQQPPAAQPPQQAAAQPEAKKYPVASFFKKLVAGNKDPKPTKPSTDYRPDVAPVPPMMLTQPQTQLQVQAAPLRPEYQFLVGATPAATVDATLPRLDGQARSPFMVTVQTTPEAQPRSLNDLPPAPESEFLPPLRSNEMPLLAGAAELPQLNGIPTAAPAVNPLAAIPAAPATDASPFSEMSEAAADEKLESNPFTGLTLKEDAGSANAPKVQPPESADASKEDPFAAELKEMGIVPPDAAPATLTPPAAEKPADAGKPQKIALEAPSFDGIEDQATREKMKKIHERGSMKGLKGFCPVTLRDQRELIDAKPDFHSTFRGQKFHFASAEAKLKFDDEPARYAPAAYGADVVALTRDKDVVEGTLDFAAWFKGRLYMFGSQETHDTFVTNPSQFATPVGIE
ncbi:MAG: hypothetical protein JWP89_5116 [Schlesneria sp.]|nr:hypothetical protein [Schlesneria sp.]